MKHLIRLSTIFAFAMFALAIVPANLSIAQDKEVEKEIKRTVELELDEEVEDDDININGKIKINGKTIELNGEEIEGFLEEHGEQLEKWAERHAGEWEQWAEKFESKMENWAESHEAEWEQWAEKYSGRWETWGSKLESGDFDAEEMGKLLERNLEMLEDMPLGSLIDGALKEGLGELRNAPLGSLGELNELVGGALEHSLEAMEKEIAGIAESEIQEHLKGLKTGKLNGALSKLQESISKKHDKLDENADRKLAELESLLSKSANLKDREKADILALLARELKDAAEAEANQARDEAKTAMQKADARAIKAGKKAKGKKFMQSEASARTEQLRELVLQQRQLADQKAKRKSLSTGVNERQAAAKKSLERHYLQLKKQKEEMETKESEIDAMRHEIMVLRKEVQRMKKQDKQKRDK